MGRRGGDEKTGANERTGVRCDQCEEGQLMEERPSEQLK